jgi:2-polyprenyl-3-methyl-5-hydroxy-6-metoxy-1,4-benzoquinol methylase
MTPPVEEKPPIELEDSRCPLGCSAGDDPVLTGHDRISGLPGEFAVVRCRECGLLRTSPRPTAGTIGFYYPADYGPYVGTRSETAAAQPGGFVRLARRLFDVRAQSIPRLRPGRLLEIGCASGSYLRAMADAGWEAEGIELSPDAAAAARRTGLDVELGAIETIEKPEGRYDLIVGWMVLEHLHDPAGGLTKLARWAKPDAAMVLSVPDASPGWARRFGSRSYGLHLPNHLYHFDRKNLARLLDANGWRVTRLVYQRTLASLLASIGYWLADHGWRRLGRRLSDFAERGSRAMTVALYPLSVVMAAFGQTGRITVWAQRKPQ